jgi:hypothetical protein
MALAPLPFRAEMPPLKVIAGEGNDAAMSRDTEEEF